MLDQILSFLGTGISAVFGWFDSLMSAELWTLVFSMISMSLVYRFLVKPFFGGRGRSGGSDKARKSIGDDDE